MPLFARKAESEPVLACPRDKTEMQKILTRGVTLDRCATCDGTWFNANELRRITGDRELERRAARIPIVREASAFACPGCGGSCLRGHVETVEVDTCMGCHGVWLDAGDLAEAARLAREQRLVATQDSGFRAFLSHL